MDKKKNGECNEQIWELLLRGWCKLNFNGSVHDNKAGVGFVIRNNIGALVRTDSFVVVLYMCLKRRLWIYRKPLCRFQL